MKHLWNQHRFLRFAEMFKAKWCWVVLKIFDVGKCHLKLFIKAISTFNPWAFDTAPAAWPFFFSHRCEMSMFPRFFKRKENSTHSWGQFFSVKVQCLFQHSQEIRSQRSQKQNRRKKQGLSNQTAWFPGIFLSNLSDHNRAVHYWITSSSQKGVPLLSSWTFAAICTHCSVVYIAINHPTHGFILDALGKKKTTIITLHLSTW